MPATTTHKAAVIASGGTTSAEVDLERYTLCGIYMPADFTGTVVTFSAAQTSGGTFLVMKDGLGSSISKTVAASQYIALDPADFAGVRYIKIISGSSEGAARSIGLALRDVA